MDGRNAWGNQVFYYNKKRQEVSVTGREAVAMPATLQEVTTVSESEFKSLLTLTRQAPLIWTSSDGRGSAGTGGSGNDGGGAGFSSGGRGSSSAGNHEGGGGDGEFF